MAGGYEERGLLGGMVMQGDDTGVMLGSMGSGRGGDGSNDGRCERDAWEKGGSMGSSTRSSRL